MKVVVLGGGFGGVEVACTLRKHAKDLEIVLVDRSTRFDYQPAYPELLSGKVTSDEITGDLHKFAAKLGAEFLHAEIVNVDFRAKTVTVKAATDAGERDVPYDYLVIALGAEQTFFGILGAEVYSHSVNTLEAALAARNALDRIEHAKTPSILVIGAGLSGVEVAGELVDYFDDRGATARISLVEMMPRVLSACPHGNVASYVETFLSARGVALMMETAVQEVREHEILFKDGRKLPYDLIIWTAGIKQNSLIEKLELPKERGRLKMDPYLRVAGFEEVFAVGDTVYVERGGICSGQNVEEAENQGKVAAENILRAITGAQLREYRPKNTIQAPRALISLGDDKAVAFFGKRMFKVLAYRMKKWIERRYMKRFR